MKDYNVTVKVRNNYLLTAMRNQGIENAAELFRLCGVGQGIIGEYLNLKRLPINPKTDNWFPSILMIAETLNKNPADLFPPQHLDKALDHNTAETEMSAEDINTFLIGTEEAEQALLPDVVFDKNQISEHIKKALGSLTPREKEVIKMRFGLDNYKEHSLAWIGDYFGLSKERIRQFEAKALRKLRHPRNSLRNVSGGT
jgi:RNA polymerase sigma factor (sigma-70 family)